MTGLEAAGLYVGLNLLIMLVLGLNTSLSRRKHKISLGDGGNEEMLGKMRAHGNAIEWMPGALIGLVVLAMMSVPVILIHVFGLLFTIARGAHGYALSSGDTRSPGRMIGSLLTLLIYLGMALALLYYAIL